MNKNKSPNSLAMEPYTEPHRNSKSIGDYIDFKDIAKHPGSYAMVLTNLVLLYGLIFLHWDGNIIVAAYFLETLIIGGFNILKMVIILIAKPQPKSGTKDVSGWGTIPFFCVHFGLFFFVQATIFLGFASMMTDNFPYKPDFIPNVFTFFSIVLKHEWDILLPNFIINQVFLLCTVFLYKKEYEYIKVETQMFKPYGRIVIQQFAVLMAGFLMFAFSSQYVMPLILILMRTVGDVIIQQWESKHKNEPNATFFTAKDYE